MLALAAARAIRQTAHEVLHIPDVALGDISTNAPEHKPDDISGYSSTNISRATSGDLSGSNLGDITPGDTNISTKTSRDVPADPEDTPAKDSPSTSPPAQCWSPTSLQEALKTGDLDSIVGILHSASLAELNVRDVAGRTPLMLAIHHDAPEVVTLLLERGADPNEGGHVGTSPLYAAVVWRRLGCAESLLRGGALVNAFGLTHRRTSLHQACTDGDEPMVELLLRFGADANLLDYGHRVALHAAAEAGAAGCVRLLVRHGAKVNVKDLEGITPLDLAHCAACQRDLVDVEASLSATGFHRLIRRSPVTLAHMLDLGVHRTDDGGVQVSYKPLRDIGVDCPFEAALVSEVQRVGRWELVQHPAVEVLLELTRQDSYFRTISFSQLFACLVFVATLFSAMVVEVYHEDLQVLSTVLKVLLVLLNVIRFFKHLVELGFTGRQYFGSLRSWPGVLTTMLTFVAVFLEEDVARRITFSITILMAFVELTLAIEAISVWKTTRAISSLLHVTRSIAEYLFMYSPLLIGFSVAFFVIFGSEDQTEDNIFGSKLLVMNMAAMALGQVDPVEAERLAPDSAVGFAVVTILFTLFVVIVPIVMLNLLLALTISDTAKFLSKGGTEFLKNLASTIAWNQHAIFTFDAWVRRLEGRLPRKLYINMATFSMRLKWRSTLPRPSTTEKDTPLIIVDAIAHDAKTMRASVIGSKRRFNVHRRLQQGLEKIVEAKMDIDAPAKTGKPSAHRRRRHAAGSSGEMSEQLRAVHEALTEQRTAQTALSEQQRAIQVLLAQQRQWLQQALAEQRDWIRTTLMEQQEAARRAAAEQQRPVGEVAMEQRTMQNMLLQRQENLQQVLTDLKQQVTSDDSGTIDTPL